MKNTFPFSLGELAHRHAETLDRLRTLSLAQPCASSRGKQVDLSSAEGDWTTTVLTSHLDLDDSSPDAFLQQLKKRLKESREAAILSHRPASHHA